MSKPVRIKNVVHRKGFAFATSPSGDVFIPPQVYAALNSPEVGDVVTVCLLTGDKGLFASLPEEDTSSNWASWQIGPKQLRLPNTQPLSHHTLSFGCPRCKVTIVPADNIFKIKDGSIWTIDEPRGLKRGQQSYNKFKGVNLHTAHCARCDFNCGSIYPHPYADVEPEKTFPCAKLTHLREDKRYGWLTNCLVILADNKAHAEESIRQLELLHSEADAGAGAGVSYTNGVRVTRVEHDLVKKLEALELKAAKASVATASGDARAAAQCVICTANEAVIAGVPCGHRCLCKDCAERWKTRRDRPCPICRAVCTALVHIYDCA